MLQTGLALGQDGAMRGDDMKMTDTSGLKWFMNIYDPEAADATWALAVRIDCSRDEEWERHLAWLDGKVIGLPKAGVYSVEELGRMGLVGVYESAGDA